MSSPITQLDDLVHQRSRLGIMAIVRAETAADFRQLREELELSEGNLSSHLRVLEEAGLVSLRKVFEARRPRTFVDITPAGQDAFAAEVAALQAIVERSNQPATPLVEQDTDAEADEQKAPKKKAKKSKKS